MKKRQGGTPLRKVKDARRAIEDSGLSLSVYDEMSLFCAVKVSFRVQSKN